MPVKYLQVTKQNLVKYCIIITKILSLYKFSNILRGRIQPMRRLSKNDIEAGMITAERITDLKNNVLLEANAVVTQAHADILKTWNIDFIRIREASDTDDSLAKQLKQDYLVDVQGVSAKKALSKGDIKSALGITVENIKSILNGSGDSKLYDADYAIPVSSGAIKISSLLNNKVLNDYVDMLQEVDKIFIGDSREREFFIRDINEFVVKLNGFIRKTTGVIGYCLYPYRVHVSPLTNHTMKTAIIAGKLAQLLDLSNKDSLNVIMGALLHDVGLTNLPDHMKGFSKKFTEEEMAFFRKHVLTGVNMVKNLKYLPREVLLIIGGHHELMDGSGYPLKLKADKIISIVRVVALANEVDIALYPLNTGREPLNIAQLVDALQHWGDKFDPDMCAVLAQYLHDFILSNRVTLDDGRIAEIIWSHKAYKEPVVRTSDGEIIDLNKVLNLMIDSYSI